MARKPKMLEWTKKAEGYVGYAGKVFRAYVIVGYNQTTPFQYKGDEFATKEEAFAKAQRDFEDDWREMTE